MPYFPVFLNFENKKVLIIGGGTVAFRKANVLKLFCENITVLSQQFECDFHEFKCLNKPFEDGDILGYDVVISATNDNNLNSKVSNLCRKNNILVNVVDDIDKSDFIFPAMHVGENIVVAVSTSGKSPLVAGKIRDNIVEILPENIDEIIEKLSEYREELKKTNLSYSEKKELLAKFYDENS